MLAAAWRSFAAGLGAALLASSAGACSEAGLDLAADEPERLSMSCADDSGWECLAWAGSEGLGFALVNETQRPVTVEITRGELFVDASVLGPGGVETLMLPRWPDPDPQDEGDHARAADPGSAHDYRLRSDGPISLRDLGVE